MGGVWSADRSDAGARAAGGKRRRPPSGHRGGVGGPDRVVPQGISSRLGPRRATKDLCQDMPELTPVLAAASELVAFCRQQRWPCCLIGGLAVQRWGEPRFTRDADLTLLTGFGEEETFIAALLGHFAARRADAADFALRARVLLLRAANGVDLDVALGALPFEERSVSRATEYEFLSGAVLPTCSAEDLVVAQGVRRSGPRLG